MTLFVMLKAVSIVLPAFGYLLVFFLCHLAIHDKERNLAISKVRVLLILYRAEGAT
jgi:hypothetical protein